MKKYDIPMMKTAQIWADMSYCERAKVGAVLAQENRIISIGYNGTAQGMENKCEEYDLICPDCQGELKEYDDFNFQCKNCNCLFKKEERLKTNHSKVIHAEANAILFCAKAGIATQGADLYVTLSPCPECAKMIIQAGIKRVVYLEKYRKEDGLNLLIENGVKVEQISF